MLVKLNIRQILTESLGDCDRIPATVHLDTLLEAVALDEGCDLNFSDILKQNRMIAQISSIADVHEVRPDLTNDQAWEVLKACDRRLDSEQGISWGTIKNVADELFGQPVDRAVRFGDAIQDYTDGDATTNLIDLLADAMHWSRNRHVDFDKSLTMARTHFEAECTDGGQP